MVRVECGESVELEELFEGEAWEVEYTSPSPASDDLRSELPHEVVAREAVHAGEPGCVAIWCPRRVP